MFGASEIASRWTCMGPPVTWAPSANEMERLLKWRAWSGFWFCRKRELNLPADGWALNYQRPKHETPNAQRPTSNVQRPTSNYKLWSSKVGRGSFLRTRLGK